MSLHDQIKAAGIRIRALKITTPEIFHAYNRLKIAQRAFEIAQHELIAAAKAWRELGEDPF